MSYTADIEVLNEALFNRHCPGKAEWIGYREWKRRLAGAVGIFGRGRVNTGLVAGVFCAFSTFVMRGLAALLAGLAWGTPAMGQSGLELREQGLRAYRALELEDATRLLRRALAAQDLPDTLVLSTQAYLGAAELYQEHLDSSRAVFRRMVLLEPRYRLDAVTFTPEVVAAFDSVRLATPAVSVDVPPRVTFEPGRAGMSARVHPSGPHTVRIRIETSRGDVIRTLYDRRASGAFTVSWDGAGDDGVRLASGLYVWSFASLDARGTVQRMLDVPVRLEHVSVDSLDLPPRPQLLPERRTVGQAMIPLGVGLAAAALNWIVMPLITDSDAPRIAISVALTAGGIVGFLESGPGRPIPQNAAANQAALARWQADVDRLSAAQGRRRPGPRIILETSRPSVRR